MGSQGLGKLSAQAALFSRYQIESPALSWSPRFCYWKIEEAPGTGPCVRVQCPWGGSDRILHLGHLFCGFWLTSKSHFMCSAISHRARFTPFELLACSTLSSISLSPIDSLLYSRISDKYTQWNRLHHIKRVCALLTLGIQHRLVRLSKVHGSSTCHQAWFCTAKGCSSLGLTFLTWVAKVSYPGPGLNGTPPP